MCIGVDKAHEQREKRSRGDCVKRADIINLE